MLREGCSCKWCGGGGGAKGTGGTHVGLGVVVAACRGPHQVSPRGVHTQGMHTGKRIQPMRQSSSVSERVVLLLV
jgi:hypothetical protein